MSDNSIQKNLTVEEVLESFDDFDPSQAQGEEQLSQLKSLCQIGTEEQDLLYSYLVFEFLPSPAPTRKRKQVLHLKEDIYDLDLKRYRSEEGILSLLYLLMSLPAIPVLAYTEARAKYDRTVKSKLLPRDSLSYIFHMLEWWRTSLPSAVLHRSLQRFASANTECILSTTVYPVTAHKKLQMWWRPLCNIGIPHSLTTNKETPES